MPGSSAPRRFACLAAPAPRTLPKRASPAPQRLTQLAGSAPGTLENVQLLSQFQQNQTTSAKYTTPFQAGNPVKLISLISFYVNLAAPDVVG